MSEIKPCPFCGDPGGGGWVGTRTYSCGCSGECDAYFEASTKEEAERLWNQRADGWISVKKRLPPPDDEYYPIMESDGAGAFVQGAIICEGFADRECLKENGMCVITHWIDCPLPAPPSGSSA